MKKFFFTFQQKSTLAHNFVIIEAMFVEGAREVMHDMYGSKFGFCYTEDTFRGQPARYGLTEVPLGTPQAIRAEYQD